MSMKCSIEAPEDAVPARPGIRWHQRRWNSQPKPKHRLHTVSVSIPVAVHHGHSAQSLSPMALWFVPVHLSLRTMRPHFPPARRMS